MQHIFFNRDIIYVMMHAIERYLAGASQEGMDLLDTNLLLQDAITRLVESKEPEKAHIPNATLLGAGSFGFTFLVEGIAVKVSSPTSSQEAFDTGERLEPEDLALQFTVLSALREHLATKVEGIITPKSHFVIKTPHNAYIYGQEYMKGWHSLRDHTIRTYGEPTGDDAKNDATVMEVLKKSKPLRARLHRALAGFTLRHFINDVGLEDGGYLHGGNLLVPAEIDGIAPDIPLCVIDQPKQDRN